MKHSLCSSPLFAFLGVLLLFSCKANGPGRPGEGPVGEVPLHPACDEELDFFREQLEIPVLSVRCAGCHNAEGVAKDSSFVLIAGDSKRNYRAAAAMAQQEVFGRSILLLKPSLTHPDGHTGGELVSVGTETYAAFEDFVEVVLDPTCNPPIARVVDCSAPSEPAIGPRLLRRLTRSEYDRTVQDLLGLPANYGARFVSDEVVDGFDNNAEALVVSPLLADQLREAAEDAASRFDVVAAAGCNAGNDCARGFVERFGLRAFRRPLSPVEVARYAALYTAFAPDGFESALRWVVTAMLQSSNFLYRLELGTAEPGTTRYTLDAYELASALSYGITGTMPDAALLEAASRGELSTPAQLEAQARRLYASEGALAGAQRFISQWLGLETLDTVPKDSELFPAFNQGMRGQLRRETEVFVEWVLREETGTLTEMLTAPYTFVDAQLADYYGVSFDASAPERAGLRMLSHAPEQQAGLLTQGSLLATHARPNGSSPVHRGVLIRERLLCQELPPPPPGVNAEPPTPDEGATDRERYAAHSEDPACNSCHRLIDPIGFGFERFDGIGRLRQGGIDDAGHVLEGETESPFQGTRGLAELLASRDDVHECFAEQYFKFSYGAAPEGALGCALSEVQAAFKESGGSIEALVVALVKAPHFVQRLGEPAEPSVEEPPPPPPPPEGELSVDVRVDSDWGGGYCHQVNVTNLGGASVDWSIVVDVDGTISTHWNAEASANSGVVTFSGVDWNNVIASGETASFGFCANR